MKIGLYGGTFDPPHNAHLTLADWVQKKIGLAYIYFIPAAIHALKNNSELSPTPIRLQLVQKAIEGYDKFRVSRIEIDRKDISYAVTTLRDFKKYENLPDSELYYILGIDNIIDFHLWKEPETILKLAKIIVLRRSGFPIQKVESQLSKKVTYLDSPFIDLSATEIRKKIKMGIDVSELIPSSVLNIINRYGLYRK